MGDGADLMTDHLESGYSLIWDSKLEKVIEVDNIELMYSVFPKHYTYLYDCDEQTFKKVAEKYNIEIINGNTRESVLEAFDY